MSTSIKSVVVALATAGLASIAFGATAEENWAKSCKMCHGADGNGTTTAIGKKPNSGIKDYTSAEVQAAMKDEEMAAAIKDGVKGEDGKQKMPSYAAKGMTDEDINALVAHIRAMKK